VGKAVQFCVAAGHTNYLVMASKHGFQGQKIIRIKGPWRSPINKRKWLKPVAKF